MKIQSKRCPTDVQTVKELQFPFYDNGKSYRWQNQNSITGVYSAYSDEEWEEVPVEQWVPACVEILAPRTMRVVKRATLTPGAVHRCIDFTLPDDMRFQYRPDGGICIERRIE